MMTPDQRMTAVHQAIVDHMEKLAAGQKDPVTHVGIDLASDPDISVTVIPCRHCGGFAPAGRPCCPDYETKFFCTCGAECDDIDGLLRHNRLEHHRTPLRPMLGRRP